MRILGIVAKWIFILCLPLLLLTGSVGVVTNSLWFYEAGFERYDVGQATGLAESELEVAARGLISYFNSGDEFISLTVVKDNKPFELFNEREIIHLKDVKGLVQLGYRVAVGTLIYVLAYAGVSLYWRRWTYWRRLAWGVVGGSSITLALILALGIGTLLNFEQLFLQFHLLSFTNELWLLDPTKDYLIMLFPQGFFYDAALLSGGITAGLAVVLGLVSGVYLRKTKE